MRSVFFEKGVLSSNKYARPRSQVTQIGAKTAPDSDEITSLPGFIGTMAAASVTSRSHERSHEGREILRAKATCLHIRQISRPDIFSRRFVRKPEEVSSELFI